MTEEIVIDGVNVAGCYDFVGSNMCNDYLDGQCEGHNCKYKQLKRLEQENRELKSYKDVNEDFKKAWDELNRKYTEVLKLAKTNADSNEYCLQELEQENKELKEFCVALERQKQTQHMQWFKRCTEINTRASQYLSALEEINKIAEPRFVNGLNEEADLCNLNMDRIQDKINEVLNDK